MTPTILEQEVRNQWFFHSINLWEKVATSENSFQPTRGFFLLLFSVLWFRKFGRFVPFMKQLFSNLCTPKKNRNFPKTNSPPHPPPPKTWQTPTSTQIMGGILNFATPLTDLYSSQIWDLFG